MSHAAHDDELLLEALLGSEPERERARAKLHARPEGAAELEELAAALARAGEHLRGTARWTAVREARFVGRVLARTTRADPSWRGDVRLALDFLRARLRASPALRIVTASLLLHLVAVPVFAYLAFRAREREPRFTIHVELPADVPFAEPAPEEPAAPDEILAAARLAEARENALARERFVLGGRGARAPLDPAAADEPLGARLLAARAAGLVARTWARFPEAVEELDPLALALWTELELDRAVLDGARDERLGPAALQLDRHARDPALLRDRPGTAALVRAALERARTLALVDGMPAAEAPLGPEWFAALERAGRETGLGGSAPWRAWLVWGGR